MPCHACRGQRTALSQFSCSTVWDQEDKLSGSGLVTSSLICWGISPASHCSYMVEETWGGKAAAGPCYNTRLSAKEPAHSPASSDFFNREFRKHIQTTAQKDWGFAAGLGWRDKEGEKLQKTGMERIEKVQHKRRTPAEHVQGPGFDPQYHLRVSGIPANLVFPLWSILFSS